MTLDEFHEKLDELIQSAFDSEDDESDGIYKLTAILGALEIHKTFLIDVWKKLLKNSDAPIS